MKKIEFSPALFREASTTINKVNEGPNVVVMEPTAKTRSLHQTYSCFFILSI